MDKQLALFYRSYLQYKKMTLTDTEVVRFNKLSKEMNSKENEDLVIMFSTCTIDEEWIKHIEAGLPFIEKAIKEERQFIRNDGEVLPIEKIRKTSKASIQDLAKHSNYITHEADPDGPSEVIPDKMLMIRKESDYTIYENRVIYAALVYLKDFVSSRLNAIKEATNTFEFNTHTNKYIDLGNRKIEFNLSLNEKRSNDPICIAKNSERELIERLDDIMSMILALLKTPLMMELSKVDLISLPVTKTNVLKMNRNFRESLALFEYIGGYSEPGYTIKKITKSLTPFNKEISEDYSAVMLLSSYLSYMHGNSLENDLKDNYLLEQKKLQEEEENRLLARLRKIHAEAKMKESDINDYLIAFEEGYRILEDRLEKLDLESKEEKARHLKQEEDLKKDFDDKLHNAKAEMEEALRENEKECEERIVKLKEETSIQIKELEDSHNQEITSMNNRMRQEQEEFKENYAQEVDQMREETKKIKEEHDSLVKENEVLKSRLVAYQAKLKEINPKDFVSKDEFNMLEMERDIFLEFFDKAWEEAKKEIKKNILGTKKEKKGKNK